nr:MAG TPA: hypothetical protein [Caudoviricetes sp.]
MNAVKNIEVIKMNEVIMIALIGIGLYAFFALVDFVKTRKATRDKRVEQFKDLVGMLKDKEE